MRSLHRFRDFLKWNVLLFDFLSNHLRSHCVVQLTTSHGKACSHTQKPNHLSLNRSLNAGSHTNHWCVRVGCCIRIEFSVTCGQDSRLKPRGGASLHKPICIIDSTHAFGQWGRNIDCSGPAKLTQDVHRRIEGCCDPTDIDDGYGRSIVTLPLETGWCEFHHYAV